MTKFFHLMRADFLERVRRDSFLLIVGLAVFLGYNTLVGFFRLELGAYRGVYNAAWIGMVMALILTFFLSLFGFYLVRGGIERDRQTGTGQIIAATPTGNLAYTMGKFGSNLLVLLVVTAVMLIAAAIMLLTKGEDTTLNLWVLGTPFLFLTLPLAALITAIAVLFETTPFLCSGLGNVVYFFLWAFALPIGGLNLLGITLVEEQVGGYLTQIDPAYNGGLLLGAAHEQTLQTFVWTGFNWSHEIVLERLMWVGVALLVTAVAAIPFDRFDRARRTLKKRRGRKIGPIFPSLTRFNRNKLVQSGQTAWIAPPFLQLIIAELKLLLKGQSFWWIVVAVGLAIACLFSPVETVRRWLLPITWVWPTLIWSQIGARENLYNSGQIVFSAPLAGVPQLGAAWLAGVVLTMLTGIGAIVPFLLAGDWIAAAMWLASALFIPALALTLGVWSGHNRIFEIVYLSLWYVGPLNGVTAVDFLGAASPNLPITQPLTLLAVTIALLGFAIVGRRRQLKHSFSIFTT